MTSQFYIYGPIQSVIVREMISIKLWVACYRSHVVYIPGVEEKGWSALENGPIHATDSHALGLLHTTFSPMDPPPAIVQSPHPPPQPSLRDAIPQSMFSSFRKLRNPNLSSVGIFLKECPW
ncbi:hypothetical protein J3A83DRAFT_359532 [Scleroderma citrinum]